ncbi:YggS family pyridoxal phosphate-dependent enzyme [Thalassolituus oleivorans]|jgi:pyridoxal phosphate enzyme (YggS family)|uniref:YggS family pyridoxal phosphate-dependent enzyme n=1 Tax=Thalassolituus oleivorans TaxID=187493 RepID=UPI001CE24008|nr:YggS family pyridoxal phosphate-dependent enzyme [Thalassolituus oleivorans]MDF1640770.1 YggS family pyridoxal phosphate-dependent enzyme [Thalassolituus oleivorans]
MSTIETQYQQVVNRIHGACDASGRKRGDVRLLAVSKTKPAEMVEACYRMGQRSFGENYLQDALDKITALSHLSDIEWHFIGPLQSNKTRPVANHFQWLETLDREKIAVRLNEQRPEGLPPLNVLIQVNISDEPQKAGIATNDVATFAQQLQSLPKLKVRGLMCIPEDTPNEEHLRHQFERMQQLLRELQQIVPEADTLSMGMSGDLELAIACGSTQVRIGTDIFGARN